MYMVNYADKRSLLLHLLRNPEIVSALVFTRTKHGADKVVQHLQKNGHNAMAIHGNKSQNARQKALSDFKSGKIRVLVATDIAARGIDVDDLSHVINYEIPNIPETYVHPYWQNRTCRAKRYCTFVVRQYRNFIPARYSAIDFSNHSGGQRSSVCNDRFYSGESTSKTSKKTDCTSAQRTGSAGKFGQPRGKTDKSSIGSDRTET